MYDEVDEEKAYQETAYFELFTKVTVMVEDAGGPNRAVPLSFDYRTTSVVLAK
jgi:hypothetical protein